VAFTGREAPAPPPRPGKTPRRNPACRGVLQPNRPEKLLAGKPHHKECDQPPGPEVEELRRRRGVMDKPVKVFQYRWAWWLVAWNPSAGLPIPPRRRRSSSTSAAINPTAYQQKNPGKKICILGTCSRGESATTWLGASECGARKTDHGVLRFGIA